MEGERRIGGEFIRGTNSVGVYRYVAAVGFLAFAAVTFYYAALVFGGCGGAFTLVLSGIGIMLIGAAVGFAALFRTALALAAIGVVILVAGLIITHGAACPVNLF